VVLPPNRAGPPRRKASSSPRSRANARLMPSNMVPFRSSSPAISVLPPSPCADPRHRRRRRNLVELWAELRLRPLHECPRCEGFLLPPGQGRLPGKILLRALIRGFRHGSDLHQSIEESVVIRRRAHLFVGQAVGFAFGKISDPGALRNNNHAGTQVGVRAPL